MLTLHCARTKEEILEVIELIVRVYTRAGYFREGSATRGISTFLFSPAARTFTVRVDGTLVGTLSVIADSTKGLPLQDIFSTELDALRQRGRRLAEVSRFAIDRKLLVSGTNDRSISLSLFKLALHYGLRKGFDFFCIAVNPKHETFYRLIGFERFGEVKQYPSVENAPAVPMKLNLKRMVDKHQNGKSENWMVEQLLVEPPEEGIY